MKLTPQQIAEIKSFVSKRGFTYPDVQLEIIDHVASRAEELMTDNPTVSLNEAIQITHGEFGIMGFSVFEDAMISNLQKKYFKQFLNTFASYFNWKYLPAIALFIYLFNRLYIVINQPQVFVIAGFIGLLIALITSGILYEVKYKRYNKLLTMKMGNIYLIVCGVIFNLWNILGNQLKLYQYLNVNWAGVIFAFLYLITILLFITVNTLRENAIKACAELDEKYHLLNTAA